jgi:hypothetical protein
MSSNTAIIYDHWLLRNKDGSCILAFKKMSDDAIAIYMVACASGLYRINAYHSQNRNIKIDEIIGVNTIFTARVIWESLISAGWIREEDGK